MQVSYRLIELASQHSLELGIKRLGADLVAVPRGLDQTLEQSYLTGEAVTFYMDRTVKDKIAGNSLVEKVSAQVFIKSLARASCCSLWNVYLIGFEPESDFTILPWLSNHPLRKINPDQILAGAGLGLEEGDTVRFYGRSLRVAGILDPTGMGLDQTVFIPIQTAYLMARESAVKAEQPLPLGPDQISAVLIKLKPARQGGMPGYRSAYELEKAIPEISIIQPDDLLVRAQANLAGTLRTLRSASYAIWAITALLIGLVFALAANERQREIGILRALGATQGFIFRMILWEALLLAGSGAIIGLILSMSILAGFSRLIALSLQVPFYWPGAFELGLLLFLAAVSALLTAGVSALVPAIQSSRQDPYEAIRRGE